MRAIFLCFLIVSLVNQQALSQDETVLMPLPTKEVNELIKKLGSNEFVVREDADQELRKLGWIALKGVYLANKDCDIEIRLRSARIYESYFILGDKIPSIWYIDESARFPEGYELKIAPVKQGSICKFLNKKDVAFEYYKKILDDSQIDQCEYYDQYRNKTTAEDATKLYVRDRLLSGEDRSKLKKAFDIWNKNSEEYFLYYQTSDLDVLSYDYMNHPPGPMIKFKDFRIPPHLLRSGG